MAEGNARRALVIDDSKLVQARLRVALRKAGWEAAGQAMAGEEGLAAARRGPWDVILLDYELPDMKGAEVARRLRAEGHATPIIAITGTLDDDLRAQLVEAGVNAVLGKPIDQAALEEELGKAGG